MAGTQTGKVTEDAGAGVLLVDDREDSHSGVT